jgi:prolyl oligopeptidase
MGMPGHRQRATPFVRPAIHFAVAAAVASTSPAAAQSAVSTSTTLQYPAAQRGPQVDEIGGVRVADPYRWLENTTSAETKTWVAAENALTETFLSKIARRSAIKELVVRAWDYPKVEPPFVGGERVFFYENGGLENQSVLYVQDRPNTTPRMLLDPNALSIDGLTAVVDQSASPDGRYLAYALSTNGSAWRTVRVRDVKSSQDGGEELRGIRGGPLAWTADSRGFFYTRSDGGRPLGANPLAPDGRDEVYYHRAGRPQSDDRLMFQGPENPWRVRADVSDDGQYLLIAARYGFDVQNRLYLFDLDNPKRPNLNSPIVKLFDRPDAVYDFAGNNGPVFFIRTTKNAPRAQLVAVDINTPDENHWTTIIRETYDPLIEIRRVDDRLIAHRLHDAHSVLELYGLNGSPRGTIPLPGVGTVTSLTAHVENRELYFAFTTFLQVPGIYRYDLDGRNTVAYKEARPDSTLSQFETAQLFYTSKDGTRVPMFITARRGIKLDGSHPTILTANAAFNRPTTPVYSPDAIAWLKLGGIYAVANVRGSGDFGRAWRDTAVGTKKQVSIDDYIAAAEFLVSQRYAHAGSLAAVGRGAGGLLAGAAILQRPDLFAASVIDAGLLDLARFDRFTDGVRWTPEFGVPQRATDLRAMLAYSPLQNVKDGVHYPPTMVCVGDRDEVMTPIHSYKFAASMQNASPGSTTLLRVDKDVGYGPGIPVMNSLARDADRIAFLADALHVQH